jgi:uncharacterized membrane protein YeaQ/YmgE (transglycosylase-associated protein family)
VLKRLMVTAVVAVVLGGLVGFFASTQQSGRSGALSDSYVGTAGHTKTYVSVATLIRKGDTTEALKLLDAMINAGAARLSDLPPDVDNDARAHITRSLAAVQQYRQSK